MSATLILMRHGQTDHNKEQRFQGHADISLNAAGRQQAQQLAQHLAGLGLSGPRLLSSDLARAKETALIVQKKLGGTLSTTPELREMSFGLWDGQGVAQMRKEQPELFARFWSGDPSCALPEGEDGHTLMRRVEAALHAHWPREGETLLVSAHGLVLTAALVRLLGLDYTETWLSRRTAHPNAAYSRLEVAGKGEVSSFELMQTAHLQEVTELPQ